MNVKIPGEVERVFREVGGHYASKREVWVPVTAAMMMFLRATPEEQAAFIKRVREAEVDGGMRRAIEWAKSEQVAAMSGGRAKHDGILFEKGAKRQGAGSGVKQPRREQEPVEK